MTYTIPLGFAVPSGDPVAIPVGHMAVVGQTQAAGKTTTLEACAWRIPDEFAVLAFITKRGEAGFTNGTHGILPYFRERADWEYVSSILEATLRERMKFERSWIMRACKGANSLADVHRNVKALMASAKGLSADIYYQLDHYLDKILPQVQSLGVARSLTLARTNVNVMDLTAFSSEMQGLIIASCLEATYKTFKQVVIVIPEAWEFLPRARKSPVTYAAELYVRKGGALKNYLWIDSQDLAGVHTPVLKQIGIWLLGVQREINEVKRTLAHVHGTKKPKADAVAGLGLGQFIACFGQQAVTTYVQPSWMGEQEAIATAITGDVRTARQIAGREEDPMDERLRVENEALRQQVDTLTRQVSELQAHIDKHHQEERRGGTQAEFQHDFHGRGTKLPPATAPAVVPAAFAARDDEEFYQRVRARLLADPPVLAALKAVQPEIVVEVVPRTVTIDGSSLKGRLARLIAQGYFDEPKIASVVNRELNRTGGQVHSGNLSKALADFVIEGFLTRTDDDWQKAPRLKVTTRELQAV